MFRIKMASVQELNTGVQTFDTRYLAPERVYKVKANMCLEKCLIPKHYFYSVYLIIITTQINILNIRYSTTSITN